MGNANQYLLRDKDFIETKDSFYQVIGYNHPENAVIAIPRYTQAKFASYWYKDGRFFQRILDNYGPEAVDNAIRNYSKQFLSYSKYYGTYVPTIPYNKIKKIYYTNSYKFYVKKDTLYKRFLEILNIFSKKIGIDEESFGLTSTMLIGISNPLISDIDIVIYGANNTILIKEYLKTSKEFAKFEKYDIEHESRIRHADVELLKKILERKWNRLLYKSREISLNPVRSFKEIEEMEKILGCENLSIIERNVEIIQLKNPFFFPIEYKVKCLEDPNIEELVIFNDFFVDCFEEGDVLFIKGMLQRVHTKEKTYYRIAFGIREAANQRISFK